MKPALLILRLVCRNGGGTCVGFLQSDDAKAMRQLLGVQDAAPILLRRTLGHRRLDLLGGRFKCHAVRGSAVRFPLEPSADGIRRMGIDTCKAQRRGIRPHIVPGVVPPDDRPPARDRIEPLARRGDQVIFEEVARPVAAADPAPFGCLLDAFGQCCADLQRRRGSRRIGNRRVRPSRRRPHAHGRR